MTESTSTIALIAVLAIPTFLAVWSFLDNPDQFIKALSARVQIFFARIYIIFSGLFWRFVLPALYIIFDPILIFIDDVIVGFVAMFSTYYFLKREFFRSIKESFPFPKPWKR